MGQNFLVPVADLGPGRFAQNIPYGADLLGLPATDPHARATVLSSWPASRSATLREQWGHCDLSRCS